MGTSINHDLYTRAPNYTEVSSDSFFALDNDLQGEIVNDPTEHNISVWSFNVSDVLGRVIATFGAHITPDQINDRYQVVGNLFETTGE
jgi:hypothetical protein